MSEENIIVEEDPEVNIVGIIPAQLKGFSNITIESITPKEIYLKIDEDRVKGKIDDTIGTVMFFSQNPETQEAEVVACAEKQVQFEHYFTIPREELTKPFIPSDALVKPN